jgi:hypothetical protein
MRLRTFAPLPRRTVGVRCLLPSPARPAAADRICGWMAILGRFLCRGCSRYRWGTAALLTPIDASQAIWLRRNPSRGSGGAQVWSTDSAHHAATLSTR